MQTEPETDYEDIEDEDTSEVSNKTVIRQGTCMAILTIVFIGICTCHIFRNQLLLVCCEKGYTTLANIFIACGANVNAVTEENSATPLLRATMNNHSNTAEMLIRAGANINARDDEGNTPLHWAAWDDHTQIAGLLIRHKADINATDSDNRTPLTNAVDNNNTEMAELFIENRADVNVKSPSGQTPISWAAEKGHSHTAELLVRSGAKSTPGENTIGRLCIWPPGTGICNSPASCCSTEPRSTCAISSTSHLWIRQHPTKSRNCCAPPVARPAKNYWRRNRSNTATRQPRLPKTDRRQQAFSARYQIKTVPWHASTV